MDYVTRLSNSLYEFIAFLYCLPKNCTLHAYAPSRLLKINVEGTCSCVCFVCCRHLLSVRKEFGKCHLNRDTNERFKRCARVCRMNANMFRRSENIFRGHLLRVGRRIMQEHIFYSWLFCQRQVPQHVLPD
jgi:hypothetical protein